MSITFSQFAKLLYTYCGNGNNKANFVKDLTNHMMKRPGHNVKDGYLNPVMNKADNTLQKYFNGSRPISSVAATVIIGHSDRYRFVQYIDTFSDDPKESIAKALCEYGYSVNRDNVAEECAEIMYKILEQSANK